MLEFFGLPYVVRGGMPRTEEPTLSLTDPEIERGVRWFSACGCVRAVPEGRCAVWLCGTLVSSFDETEFALRNVTVVLLSMDPSIHLGRLSEAFELSSERVRQLRRLFERDGLEALARSRGRGRPRILGDREIGRLEKMFAAGASVDQAHARVKKGSYATIANLRSAWKKRTAEQEISKQNVDVPAVEQLSLPMSVSREGSTLQADKPVLDGQEQVEQEPSPQVDATRAATTASHVRQDALHSLRGERAPFVQHLGSWLIIAMAARLGLYRCAAAVGEGEVDLHALRVVLDGVITALAIGEECVEGLRRIETPTAQILLRSAHVPSATEARALLSRFAAGHIGMAPLRLQYAMLQEYAADERRTREDVPVFYVDNHLRKYSGKRVVRRGWRMQDKRVAPGITDVYAHDEQGNPWMQISSPDNDSLTRWLENVGGILRSALENERRILLAFDRGGAFAETLAALRDRDLEFVTWERRPYPALLPSAFTETVELGDEVLRFTESRINLGAGRGRVRRISVRDIHGRQFNLLAASQYPAARLIEIMRGRWVQENGFKHGVERWGINQLDDRKTMPVDAETVIPNPARRRLDRALRAARLAEGEARRKLAGLHAEDPQRARWDAALRGSLQQQEELLALRPEVPKRARLATTELAGVLVQHDGRRKHVLDTVRIACANAESDLAVLLAEHLGRPAEAKRLLANVFSAPGRVRRSRGTWVVELSVAANRAERQSLQRFFADLDRLGLTLPGDSGGSRLRFRAQSFLEA